MNIFGNLTREGLEDSVDRVGGPVIIDSGVHTGTIKMAYASKSTGGAQAVNLVIAIGNQEYKETIYVTSKSGLNYYQDKSDPNKKQPMPGFDIVDHLCLVTTGQSLKDQVIEDKVILLFDFETKRDMPTNVPVLTGLLGQPCKLGIVRSTVDVTKKDTDGIYRATGAVKDENNIDKVFQVETDRTVPEILAGLAVAGTMEKWTARNKGVTRVKAKGAEGNTGAPGLPGTKPGAPSGLFAAANQVASAPVAASSGLFGR